MNYDFLAIEQHWQQYWADHQTFRTPNPGDEGFNARQPKFYVLDMFPYPSGVGLHVGHPLGYIATDIVARFKRMQGFNVLHPMGYDAFGLAAEQFAVEHGIHPRITTETNSNNMTRQLKRLGLSYDWDRCLATTEPEYYRWTQWIFLQLYNSYYDPVAKQARPIAGLVRMLESEELYVGIDDQLVTSSGSGLDAVTGRPIGSRKWFELPPQEQQELLDGLRLAYLAEVPVNWCPALGTVLANEEVTNDGRSERGNFLVYKRPLRQWMLRITAYAPRLEDDLELVDWPEPIKIMQRNWIGRSDGAVVDFPLAMGTAQEEGETIGIFTTRPDTLFGATYMVLAPEHPLVDDITPADYYHAVNQYRAQAAGKTDMDRQTEAAEGAKTGVFTGAYALNPVNNDKIPIWIADYVMMGYGTGAIMAVPAHDERDFAFARQFGLPIKAVVMPDEGFFKRAAKQMGKNPAEAQSPVFQDAYIRNAGSFPFAFTGEGNAMNSANDSISLEDLPTAQAKQKITAWLESEGLGKAQTQFKLRDWLFSRQRYWGEPFPILHGPNGEVVPLKDSELPLLLPEMENFKPSASDDPNAPPQPPLARAPDAWKYVERDGVRYTREFNTMPQWAGSCWYYLRFCDPHDDQRFVNKEAEKYWMVSPKQNGQAHAGGVDLYVGGAEHAVLHLLYSRFWHKVLFDLGHVSTPEPFGRLFNQGMIQAYAYTDARGIYVPADEVEEKDGKFYYQGQVVNQEFGKIGKSLKNAVPPDKVCDDYGCDTLRLYEMYMGPLDQSKIWTTRDIVGVHRFLQRLWRNLVDEATGKMRLNSEPAPADLRRLLHKTIKRVTDAMNAMSFNVAIAALIECNNELVGKESIPHEVAQTLVLLLAPLAPHIAEELWSKLGHDQSLVHHPWPGYDAALLVEDKVEYPVQVNGKLRGHVTLAADADDKAIEQAALADEKTKVWLAGKTVRKVIVIKGKLVNVVAV